jgi:hypothetical protein
MGSSGARAKFSSNPRAKFSLKWRVKVGPGPSVSSSDAVKDPGARLGQPGGSTPPRSAAVSAADLQPLSGAIRESSLAAASIPVDQCSLSRLLLLEGSTARDSNPAGGDSVSSISSEQNVLGVVVPEGYFAGGYVSKANESSFTAVFSFSFFIIMIKPCNPFPIFNYEKKKNIYILSVNLRLLYNHL